MDGSRPTHLHSLVLDATQQSGSSKMELLMGPSQVSVCVCMYVNVCAEVLVQMGSCKFHGCSSLANCQLLLLPTNLISNELQVNVVVSHCLCK